MRKTAGLHQALALDASRPAENNPASDRPFAQK